LPSKSLSRSSLLSFQKYSSLLAGNDPYIPFFSDYELLASEVLASDTATVTFSGLDSSYSSDFQHLQLRIVSRTDAAANGGGDILKMTFNSDTGTNYGWHSFFGFNGSIISNGEDGINRSYVPIQRSPDAGVAANIFAPAVIDLLDSFSTSKYKVVRYISGQPNNANYVFTYSGRWQNTNAIDSINFDPYSGSNIVAGSRISLYGLRKPGA
jgi:hypothetical protein